MITRVAAARRLRRATSPETVAPSPCTRPPAGMRSPHSNTIRLPTRRGQAQYSASRSSDLLRAIVAGERSPWLESCDSIQGVAQLGSNSDVELGEDPIQVPPNSAAREEQALADLTVRQSFGRELSDLELLGGEALPRVESSADDPLASRAHLQSRALAPCG